MAISQNFPNQLPALSLNFAGSKLLDPRITFTRSSSATYVDDDGLIKTASTDVPRFEHNPVTGECLGLLIEDPRTNISNYSVFSFSGSTGYPTGWTSFNPGRVVKSVASFLDLTDSAIVGKQYGNSGGFRKSTNISLSTFTTYTVSWYARKPTDSELSLFLGFYPTNDTTGQPYVKGSYMRYDDTVGGLGSSNRFTLTDDWSRFSYTFSSGGATSFNPNFTTVTVDNNYAPNDLFVISGVQVEAGSFASSYIPTSGSAVTRSQDFAQMTGSNFSSWYTATEGTLYAEYSFNGINGLYNNPVVMLNNGTETYSIFITASDAYGVVNHPSALGGVSFIGTVGGTTSPGVTYKSALAFKLDDFAFTLNGLTPVTDFGGPLPTVDRMYIGRRVTLDSSLYGPIKRLVYYPVKFTNSQIQALTK